MYAPSRASELPSPAALNSAYFLLVVLLRQRSRLVHRAVSLLIVTIRGLLLPAAWRFAPHRRVVVCSSPPRGGLLLTAAWRFAPHRRVAMAWDADIDEMLADDSFLE